jgi:hypothetical protein
MLARIAEFVEGLDNALSKHHGTLSVIGGQDQAILMGRELSLSQCIQLYCNRWVGRLMYTVMLEA